MKYLLLMFVSFGVQANTQYDPIISAAAAKYDVPFTLVKAVIEKESSFRKNICSKGGACGLMQLMPSKAKKYGVKNRLNAAQNIDGGVHLLHDLFEHFGDLDLVLAAYNAGENVVAKRGVPPYRETKRILLNRLRLWRQAMQVVKELLELPEYVEFEGLTYRLSLDRKHSDELCLSYDFEGCSESSKHFEAVSQCEVIRSEAHPYANLSSFIFLCGGIYNDADLIEAIHECKEFVVNV
jgi:hypothetical protein